MSWVPLAGSAAGNVLGGIVADRLGGTSSTRLFLAGAGTLLALPLALAAFLPSPLCFLDMTGSGLVGEAYLPPALAALTERAAPGGRLTSLALFVFVITFIGGNAPLLVPLVRGQLEGHQEKRVVIEFTAAGIYSRWRGGMPGVCSGLLPPSNGLSAGLSLLAASLWKSQTASTSMLNKDKVQIKDVHFYPLPLAELDHENDDDSDPGKAFVTRH